MDLTHFDVEELLHLGMKLTAQQRYADALACLKRAARLDPHNGTVTYFIAVVYAQINLYERALTTMKHAVQLEPGLDIAHFQIGLLYFTSNRLAEAIEAWRPLDRLGEEHPLFLFKAGLEALARDDFATCRRYLNRGIRLNATNEPLNNDMRAVLQRIEGQPTSVPAAAAPEAPGSDAPGLPVRDPLAVQPPSITQ